MRTSPQNRNTNINIGIIYLGYPPVIWNSNNLIWYIQALLRSMTTWFQ